MPLSFSAEKGNASNLFKILNLQHASCSHIFTYDNLRLGCLANLALFTIEQVKNCKSRKLPVF